jgi:uncharacterized protein YfiM (DUF2279 family)
LATVALASVPLGAQPPVDGAPVLAAPAVPDTTRPPAPRADDPWLGSDKLRHFVLAGLVQGAAFGAATTAGVRQRSALVSASAVTAVVSIGKEVHDRRRGGRVSGRDLAWDAAGGALWGVLLARSGR